MPRAALRWVHDRSLTLVMLGLFAVFTVGQVLTGWHEFNDELTAHGRAALSLGGYLATGHLWEAIFENWESEFLQMAAFVTFTTCLYQKGSPESRRPGVVELVDSDPRDFSRLPACRGRCVEADGCCSGTNDRWASRCSPCSSSRGSANGGGFVAYADEQVAHALPRPEFTGYLTSSRLWFESFQNWQSEFLSVGVMVWLAVYLRQRGSPESKPVHAPHAETGR